MGQKNLHLFESFYKNISFAAFSVLHVRPCLHRAGAAVAAVPVALRVCPALRVAHEEVRLPVAQGLRVSTVLVDGRRALHRPADAGRNVGRNDN